MGWGRTIPLVRYQIHPTQSPGTPTINRDNPYLGLASEDEQDNLRTRRRFEVYCQEWEKNYDQSEEALLTGVRLREVETWVDKAQPTLSEGERRFLQKSVARRCREAKQRRNVLVGIVLSVISFVSGIAGLQWQVNYNSKLQLADSFVTQAKLFYESNRQLEALMASIKALNVLQTVNEKDQ